MHIWLLFLFTPIIHINCFVLKKGFVKMSSNDNIDWTVVHKYKNLLTKDTYNNIIQNIMHNKVDKLFINNNYKEIISVDNLPKTDFIYNHYHVAPINPVVLPNLVEKTSELHVPIFFTDFDTNFFSIDNLLSLSSSFLGLVFPLYIVGNLILFALRRNNPSININISKNNNKQKN